MDMSISSQMAQERLFDQVGAALDRKGLDQQKIEGQNTLDLLAASAVITDPALGRHVNQTA